MQRNLFDFGDENLKESAEFFDSQAKKIDEQTKKEAENYYEKYKNYSRDELMQEFLTQTKKNIKSGNFSKQKFENTISSLTPFLNDEQKNFLRFLKEKIDDIE